MTESSADELRIERKGPALWLTLDRPHRRNALTLSLANALADAISNPGQDVRVIVLTGEPPAFCSGGDLADLKAIAEQGPLAVTEVVYECYHRLVSSVGAASVPVIAAVNGPAVGGGFDLALWCDLRVATTDATFVSSWINLGLVPGMGGAHLLTRIIGATRATEVVLLGRPVDAQVALAWGLVNAVVPPHQLESYIGGLVETLASLSPLAVQRSKAALRRARDAGIAEELVTLGAVQATLSTEFDFQAVEDRLRTKS